MKKAVIVLPTYNEAGNIESLLEEIFAVTEGINNWDIHVVVVDSKSPDKTAEIVMKLQKKYKKLDLLPTEKEGLGRAYIHGFNYAIEKLNPFLLFEMDGDGQHNPKKIPEFLKNIETGADLVNGSRYMKGGGIPKEWGLMRKIYSIPGNIIIRLGFMKFSITDWTGGFKAIKAWIIKEAMPHINNYSGYVFQIALMDFVIKKHAIIKEIPIQFRERRKGESKINSTGYISQILTYIFQHSSFVKFSLVGGIGFIIDFGISYLLIEQMGVAIWLATVISTETAILVNFILNNFWSFSHKKLEHSAKVYITSLVKFNIVSSVSIFIQSFGVHSASVMFGENRWYIYKVLIIVFIIIPYSYFFYNKVIWKGKD